MTARVLSGLMVLATAGAAAAADPAGTFMCVGETRSVTISAQDGPLGMAIDGSDTVHEAQAFDMLSQVQVQFVDVIAGTAVQLELAGSAEAAKATLTINTMGGDAVIEAAACDDHDGLVAAVRAAAE